MNDTCCVNTNSNWEMLLYPDEFKSLVSFDSNGTQVYFKNDKTDKFKDTVTLKYLKPEQYCFQPDDTIFIKYSSNYPFFLCLYTSEETYWRAPIMPSSDTREQVYLLEDFQLPENEDWLSSLKIEDIEAIGIVPLVRDVCTASIKIDEIIINLKNKKSIYPSNNMDVPESLDQGFVSICMDDSWDTQFSLGVPELDKRDLKSTIYHLTAPLENNYTTNMSWLNALEIANNGHEVASHTVFHKNLIKQSEDIIDKELKNSKRWLELALGRQVRNFSSPYGKFNPQIKDVATKYYDSHRTVNVGLNSQNSDLYGLRAYDILNTFPVSQVKKIIDHAVLTNGWCIFFFHKFINGPALQELQCNLKNFKRILDYVVQVKICNITVAQGTEIMKLKKKIK